MSRTTAGTGEDRWPGGEVTGGQVRQRGEQEHGALLRVDSPAQELGLGGGHYPKVDTVDMVDLVDTVDRVDMVDMVDTVDRVDIW